MMGSPGRLQGRRVLVIEDDFMIGDALKACLEDEGAEILGPIGWADEALGFVERLDTMFDVAVLDVDLHGERSYAIADILEQRGIRFMFTTGYADGAIDAAYRRHPRYEKPLNARMLIAMLVALIDDPVVP